jgi:2-octaprenylphenol hydroxylase
MRQREILIVGGGPVGLTVAGLLSNGPCSESARICLLEPRPFPRWSAERMDLRVYALSRASERILGHIGVWQALLALRASPYRSMRIWQGKDPQGPGSLHFDSADLGEPDLGHIVEDGLLRRVLSDHLSAAGIELVTGAGVERLERSAGRIRATTASGEQRDADLLIAADGAESKVRALLGFPVIRRTYDQEALVAHVATERPHEETAWQRFMPSGPLAFLPLLDGRSSIVWSTTREQADHLLEASRREFTDALQDASGGVLGELMPGERLAHFPLRAIHARSYCQPRAALIGDAAHTVHPLAGQGMNLGLLDAAYLAEVTERAMLDGEDPGDVKVLRRYERGRKGENLKMLLALDGLHRLFGLPSVLDGLKASGLAAVNALGPAKTFLARQALGIHGELPTAARFVSASR